MSELQEVLRIDKSDWGEGPWQTEHDRVDFVSHGFAAFIRRHERHGYWCGYVGVPREHPLYGKHWRDACDDFQAHRGVNYSAKCRPPVCHVPPPGMPDDVWWFGFDCGHMFDLAPGAEAMVREMMRESTSPPMPQKPPELAAMEVYRTESYAMRETKKLAAQLQLAAITNG